MYVCMYVCICICTYIRKYVCTYVCMYVYKDYMYVYMRQLEQLARHLYIDIFTYTHTGYLPTYIHAPTYIHTYLHTYTFGKGGARRASCVAMPQQHVCD